MNCLTLVSHKLCPYVQRAAIVLHEKQVAFDRRWVDLADKPDWFRAISPLGKTPVLVAGDVPIFESAVICEYLDETIAPRLHPEHALTRARHRGWMEFGSNVLNTIAAFYNAPDAAVLETRREELRARFMQIEPEVTGPYFSGDAFSMVDAVFAPIFRYLDVFERIGDFGMLEGLPKAAAWRVALALRPSVRAAASLHYPALLTAFLARRGSALSLRVPSPAR